MFRCLAASWIYSDNSCVRFDRSPFPNHLEENRVIYRHVRADNQKNVGVLNIIVTGRRSIGTERLYITDYRRGHTEPTVRVYVIRPEESFEEFIENVRSLCVQLSRPVECDGIFAVLQLDFVKPICGEGDGFVPRNPTWGFASAVANHRIRESAIVVLKDLFEVRAFWTEHTVVWGDIVVC